MSTLDLGTLNELREMLEEGLDELLDEYLKDAPSQLSKLGDVIEAGDVQAISEVAHSLKGSSGNLGIRAVYSLCQQLEQEAEQIVDQYIQQGQEAKARILEEAQSAAEKLEEQARRNIDHEFKKAREQLQAEVMEKALAKAEEVIKSRISDKDQERLVDEYLEKVVA